MIIPSEGNTSSFGSYKEIGKLDHTWNYLVGVYNDIADPKLIHYTEGGPWFENYRHCEFHELWKHELADMMK